MKDKILISSPDMSKVIHVIVNTHFITKNAELFTYLKAKTFPRPSATDQGPVCSLAQSRCCCGCQAAVCGGR